MFKHILMPTDGSDASLRAIAAGAELALAIGAKVTLMSVVEHYPRGVTSASYLPDDATMRSVADQRLDSAEARAREAGLASCARLTITDQPVHRGIVEAAKSTGADLIVMSTHGLSAFDRMLVGSQTQRVLAHTQTPVLVMH